MNSNLQSGLVMIGLGSALLVAWVTGAFGTLIDGVAGAVRGDGRLELGGDVAPAVAPSFAPAPPRSSARSA
jgi:hypothetical protein